MSRLRADLFLLFTAFIWGTAFVAQKIANDSIGPATFVGVRFLISALAVLPFAWLEFRREPTRLDGQDWGIAATVSFCLFAGAMLQQFGMLTTTATNAGFLTALYVVLVPFVVWVLTRHRPSGLVVVACIISVIGAWLLAGGGGMTFHIGDAMLVLGDIAWAIIIAIVPIFLNRTHRPYFLSFAQFSLTGMLGLAYGLAFEHVDWLAVASVWGPLLYAGLISGGIAYTMQIFAQKHAPAAEAALILSLESVFAAIAGALMLGERLSFIAATGCALILFGVVLVEVGPTFLRGKATT